MLPKGLKLLPQFRAEFLDPFHRHESLANLLYASWVQYTKDNTENETLTFSSWVIKYHNTPKKPDRVVYVPPQEINFYLVNFLNSKAYLNNRLLTCEKNMKGTIPFALSISLTEDVLVIPFTRDETKPRQHHSSTVAGRDVLFAGELFANDGNINSITDQSGHYHPDLYSFVYGLNCIVRKGADLSSTKIIVNSWSFDSKEYSDALLFIKLYTEGFDDHKYKSEHETIEQAQDAYRSSVFNQSAIYFVKSENELFELDFDSKGEIVTTSFSTKYHIQLEDKKEPVRKVKIGRRLSFSLD